jgi:hypothetical protein
MSRKPFKLAQKEVDKHAIVSMIVTYEVPVPGCASGLEITPKTSEKTKKINIATEAIICHVKNQKCHIKKNAANQIPVVVVSKF